MKAINIKWDIDYDENGMLPTEIEIPKNIKDIDDITEYLSDFTGYCHEGYDLADAYTYEIYLDDLDGGNLVGNSGEWYFHDAETAKQDAKDYISQGLVEEYHRDAKEFRIVIQHISAAVNK